MQVLKNKTFFQLINSFKKPIFLIINKIDLVDQSKLNRVVDFWTNKLPKAKLLAISALKKFNISRIKQDIVNTLPQSPPYFPKDTLTDKSERFVVSEIIRDKILDRYKEEIPYSVEVVVDSFNNKEKVLVINAIIYVERESQKTILIGKGGRALNAVGVAARKAMQNFFQKKIFLGLFVKVEKNWRSRKSKLKQFGYN